MNLRYIDWIWRVRGSVETGPGRGSEKVFESIDDLFQQPNTSYAIEGDALTFTKSKQLPQDKMSIYDSGTLWVADGRLRFDMMSKALLACFLAPLFFFALGHIGMALDQWRNPPEVAAAKKERAEKRSLVKPEDVPMHPIDKFLGAHEPKKEKKDGEEGAKKDRKPSMKTAYTFMGIFFGLWFAGRILEYKLFQIRLRKRLGIATNPLPRIRIGKWFIPVPRFSTGTR